MSKKKEDVFEEIAGRVVAYANAENKQFGIDPMTVLAILQLMLTVIRVIYGCRSTRSGAKQIIKKPGVISRLMMRRVIAKQFKASERKAVYNALLQVSGTLSEKELDNILDVYETTMENMK